MTESSWGQIRQECHLTASAILLKVRNHAELSLYPESESKKKHNSIFFQLDKQHVCLPIL